MKNKSTIISLVLVGLMLVLGTFLAITYFSTRNKEIRLRKQVEAKQEVCKSFYSKMFTEIKEIAQVADQYKETFKEVYPALMEGRYGNARGGALMSWVQESNPNFDIKLYDRLITVIESNREDFQVQQEQLIDLKRNYDSWIEQVPTSWFLPSDITSIKITTIIVKASQKAFESGEDQEIDIFNKKSTK